MGEQGARHLRADKSATTKKEKKKEKEKKGV
jgi:hypothetical protein